ncbi:hypothetical protein MUP65_02105, partial [Patescibacteria group bacterium]|nr:hypothetical protein [Patescibacteria group bacterium]
ANCGNDGEKVRLVVIDCVQKPLSQFTEPELALDGYLSTEESVNASQVAAEDLRTYGGKYDQVTVETEMVGIMFIPETAYSQLTEERRARLTQLGLEAATDSEQEFRNII